MVGEKGTLYSPACLTCGWCGGDGTRAEAETEAAMHQRGERHPWRRSADRRTLATGRPDDARSVLIKRRAGGYAFGMADDPQNSDSTPAPPTPPSPEPDPGNQPVQGIDVPGADLGLSEGRKGMIALPNEGNPSSLVDVFNKIDAAPPATPAPEAPSDPSLPAPPSDTE
jgi:hypothetical protein